MKAFIISVNGKTICTAGIGDQGVLTTILTWLRRKGEASGEFNFEVGGLDSLTHENVVWKTPKLKVGDTVTIKIIETDSVDTEAVRWSAGPTPNKARKKSAVRRKAKSEGTVPRSKA